MDGLNLLCAEYRSSHRFERHIHDEIVLTITKRGAGNAEARSLSDWTRPGSIWVSGMGEYHSGNVNGAIGWHYTAFYLDTSFFAAQAEEYFERSGTSAIRPGVLQDSELARELLNYQSALKAGKSSIERETIWFSAMQLLLDRYAETSRSRSNDKKEHSRMKIVQDYIAAHFRENVSVQDLSSLVGLSRFHFVRAFKHHVGISPYAYVNQLRLNRARSLLLDGVSPANAAVEVGLYDQSHLNRLFKKKYGLSPGTYYKAGKSSATR